MVSSNLRGEPEYKEFNRYDFLEQDEAGDWHWIDDFLFSCDTSAPLASNREAMWQETRMNLQTGAFGDPTSLQTLILFWTKMEMLHYPGASETRAYLEEELQRQMMQQRMQAQMQQMQMQAMARQRQTQAAGQAVQQVQQDGGGGGVDAATAQAVIQQAQQDAARDAAANQQTAAPAQAGAV